MADSYLMLWATVLTWCGIGLLCGQWLGVRLERIAWLERSIPLNMKPSGRSDHE